MENAVTNFWNNKLAAVKLNLEKNNFDAFIANDVRAVRKIVAEKILPALSPKIVSWGGSETFKATELYEEFERNRNISMIDPFEQGITTGDTIKRRREALSADLFITGSNAITYKGQLVNLDRTGNRVAALAYGPKNILVLAGRNKVTSNLDAAIDRIKTLAAPMNANRLGLNTPCCKTTICSDCNSPQRLCNTWSIIEKSYPKGRIIVLLINECLGF
jgi:hypothetical protein